MRKVLSKKRSLNYNQQLNVESTHIFRHTVRHLKYLYISLLYNRLLVPTFTVITLF